MRIPALNVPALIIALSCTAASCVAAGRPARAQEPPGQGVKVIELFTSQGCASCPPAEAVFNTYAGRPGVLPLAFHVKWWDYLGWPDPFALKVADQRQKSYARLWHLRALFTPQVVVQGEKTGVGSTQAQVRHLLAEVRPVPVIVLTRTADGLVAHIPALPDAGPAELWLVAYDRRKVTQVGRGENADRRLVNDNVVRWAGPVAEVARTPAAIAMPDTMVDGHDDAAVLLQSPHMGPLLGAGYIRLR